MGTVRTLFRLLPLLTLLVVGACAAGRDGPPPPADRKQMAELAEQIAALGDDVDPEEAERAARVAYEHTHELAVQYQITDPPLIHNMKVNAGLKPRGLCYQWADDIEARLAQENFKTLDLHRAIANSDSAFRIEHSTTIISRRGDDMFAGIVLDPWRNGGELYWNRTLDDDHYVWIPRDQVFANKRKRLAAKNARAR